MAAAAHLTRSKIAAKKSDCPKKTENDDTAVARILALHDAHQERRREHRKGIRSDIVAAVEIGLEMQDDREEWAYFCKYSWESGGPEEDQIDQAVRFAIKFMVGPGKGAQKKASFYYNAVALLVQEEGLRGEDLEDRLEKEGLKKLAAEYAKHKKEKRRKRKSIMTTRTTVTRAVDLRKTIPKMHRKRPARLTRVLIRKVKKRMISISLIAGPAIPLLTGPGL
ncbi:hypothetical protein [Rhizobium sp. NFACC06-2]|uniref:hypothetical protein n=1 Tax=Rhizobium sp. NFACC06-2 TaxID=1566264 RepID=UPI000876DC5F|nr:hypothetical protein [Rhizobium sp. NFACC06-2]SCY69155.1 hypothetical protein SAMN03159288_03711 [Rhizobium sp. NFACC06-2]